MSIAPVHVEVEISQPPAEAFALFTRRIGEWWVGKGIGALPRASITIEPHVGGRWFETDEQGHETLWGKVLAWEPPSHLVLSWELNSRFEPDPAIQTEIALGFVPVAGGGTRISLEHRHLERFGVDADRVAGSIGEGWPKQLGGFADHAASATDKAR